MELATEEAQEDVRQEIAAPTPETPGHTPDIKTSGNTQSPTSSPFSEFSTPPPVNAAPMSNSASPVGGSVTDTAAQSQALISAAPASISAVIRRPRACARCDQMKLDCEWPDYSDGASDDSSDDTTCVQCHVERIPCLTVFDAPLDSPGDSIPPSVTEVAGPGSEISGDSMNTLLLRELRESQIAVLTELRTISQGISSLVELMQKEKVEIVESAGTQGVPE